MSFIKGIQKIYIFSFFIENLLVVQSQASSGWLNRKIFTHLLLTLPNGRLRIIRSLFVFDF
jgi:hypothetical protein